MIFAPNADDVLAAITLQGQAAVELLGRNGGGAAAQLGCDVLWTEDLNDGQLVRGVRIRNPFLTQ
jgi:hypothetical protein